MTDRKEPTHTWTLNEVRFGVHRGEMFLLTEVEDALGNLAWERCGRFKAEKALGCGSDFATEQVLVREVLRLTQPQEKNHG